MMDPVFEEAVNSSGPGYEEAERKLRDARAGALPTLRRNLHHSDPVARLIARVILDWFEGSAQDYQAALDYLDYVPRRLARTPIGNPSPLGVAAYLTQHFGARVVDLLAVRLVKGTDWPHWRVMAVLFYLRDHARPSITEVLLRFAAGTQNDEWRGAAIDAIRAAQDPDLRAKIEAERVYQAALGRGLHPTIVGLGMGHH